MKTLFEEVRQFFDSQDIPCTLKGFLYLCSVDERQFYYSPNTGKWKIKGQSRWFKSSTPYDFLVQARQYSPPNYQEKYRSSQKDPYKKNQRQKKRSSSQKQSYSHSSNYYYSYYSSTKHFQRPDGLSAEFINIFEQCLLEQRFKGYKVGWLWHNLIKSFTPSAIEICWLSVILDYSPGWAYHKIKDFFGYIEYQAILTVIQDHRHLWLEYFHRNWSPHQQHQQHQQHQSHQSHQSHQRQHQHQQHSHTKQKTNPYQDYLDALNLCYPLTKEQLKSAYRRKAKETHPDMGGSSEAFRLVNRAYEFLVQVI